MANATANTHVESPNATLTREREQRTIVILESASVADTNTLEYVRPAEYGDGGEAAVPHMGVEIYTHDGGFENGSAAATYATSDGETIVFEFWDPDNAANEAPNAHDGAQVMKWTEVVHVLSGVTGGAATPAQIVASLNADPYFSAWAYAAASIATANAVTVFPRGPRGRVRIGTGSTSAFASLFSGTGADNAQRIFTRVGPNIAADPWDVSYDAGDRKVIITNNTAATVERVCAVISLF